MRWQKWNRIRIDLARLADPIITQGRQAITESRGRYRVHNFLKPVTHKQKHRNRRISAQSVKKMLKFTPITVSLPGNAVLRHNCTHKFHLAHNPRIPNVFRTSNLPVSINVICSCGITTSGTRSFPNHDSSDRGRELAFHPTNIQFKMNASSLSISRGRSAVCLCDAR